MALTGRAAVHKWKDFCFFYLIVILSKLNSRRAEIAVFVHFIFTILLHKDAHLLGFFFVSKEFSVKAHINKISCSKSAN